MRYTTIPPERIERTPLLSDAGYRMLKRIEEHADAPTWSYFVGDRLVSEDVLGVESFREVIALRRPAAGATPSQEILEWVERQRRRSWLFRSRIPEGFNISADWAHIPTMNREDLAVRVEQIVPVDEDLSRLIAYDTSGTTGHAVVVPHHPGAVAKNHALIEFVLARYGVRPVFAPDGVACINAYARTNTVTFPNVFTVWNQAGFAKVNMREREWPGGLAGARRFFADLAPVFLTGDPIGFDEMMRWEIELRPKAMITTALALGAALRGVLEATYGCSVIDWYSTTETGPIAYACPRGMGLHVLPPDLHVEVLDADGEPAPPGQRGEITVTGGRNPFLPLLRYRTGDYARMESAACECGDASPRLIELEGRDVVLFHATDGSRVNPVDLGLILREAPIVQHEFVQQPDGSIDVTLRPAAGCPVDAERLEERLRTQFGIDATIHVRIDRALGDGAPAGKVVPYRSYFEGGAS